MGVLGRVLVPALLLRPGAAQPALKFAFDVDVSSWDVWFNQTRDQCNDRDTVDQAMAAFRRDDGSVVAFSGDNDIKGNGVPVPGGGFFRMVGSSLHDLVRDCTAPVLKGGPAFADPASYPHSVWLMATWTEDGETVHGLVHDEYHANVTDAEMCPAGDHGICWYSTILAVKSTDGGRTFEYQTSPQNPRGIAVSSPVGYQPGQEGGRPQGTSAGGHHLVHDPHDGYLYLLTGCGQGAHLPGGEIGRCVWRTKDISDVAAWRGWNGAAWTVTSVDPYASPARSSEGHLPALVSGSLPGPQSVVYHEGLELFIAMGSSLTSASGERPKVQTWYMTSTNMTTWSNKRAAAAAFELPGPFLDRANYPHLIDADSPSRNFDVIGRASKSVYLQLITHIPHTGPGFPRAGVAIPVTVELAAEGTAELASEDELSAERFPQLV